MSAASGTNRLIAEMVRAGASNLSIASRVGLTDRAVERRIVKMRAAGIDLPHRVGYGSGEAWSVEEDARLAALYLSYPDSVLGAKLKRTATAIARRRARLGLHRPAYVNDGGHGKSVKPRGYSKAELNWARNNATTGPNCEARMMLAFAADHARWRKRKDEVTQQ